MNKISKFINIICNRYYRANLLKGVAAGVEHEAILSTLSCNTLVDIGANRGQFALVSRYCFPQARIFAFEPLLEPASLFRRIFEDDELTTLYPFAIGPRKETTQIHISNRDDSSSLLPITPLQVALFSGTAEKNLATINVKPLSAKVTEEELISTALLKLDVQGYELQVLKGCVDLLPFFNYIYVECSFVELYLGQALADEVIAFLYEQNFRLNGIHNVSYDRTGKAVQADFFFLACAKSKSTSRTPDTNVIASG